MAEGQAQEGRHRTNPLYRPAGAVKDRTPVPTVSTVGYVVTTSGTPNKTKTG